MTLEDFVAAFAVARDVKAGTIDMYRQSVRCLGTWMTRPPELNDLSDDLLNRWVTWMLDRGYARATAKNRLGAVATLWRAAEDAGHVQTFPRRLKRVKLPPPLPEAWDESQMVALLAACEKLWAGDSAGSISRAARRCGPTC